MRGTKVCSEDLGQMTKVAATPIYGKQTLKVFFSGAKAPMNLELGMQHLVFRPNNLCSNNYLWLTLTFFTAGKICFLMLLSCLYGKR